MTNLSKILSLDNVQLDLEVSSKKRAFEQAGLIFENNCGIARSTVRKTCLRASAWVPPVWAMAWLSRTDASRAARA